MNNLDIPTYWKHAQNRSCSALMDGHMLTNEEEVQLVEGLRMAEDDQWLKLLYRCKCKKVRMLSV